MMKLACQRNDILSGCMDVCALLDSQFIQLDVEIKR
ncbi:hypothetical protein WP7W18E02_01900 [Aeromonas media]|jgi:hypothetical protein|nr:hypothetical protein WP7W18E02_01900 [Aeromonas media]